MKIGIEEHALLYGLLVKNACAVLGEEKGKELPRKKDEEKCPAAWLW